MPPEMGLNIGSPETLLFVVSGADDVLISLILTPPKTPPVAGAKVFYSSQLSFTTLFSAGFIKGFDSTAGDAEPKSEFG